MTQQYVNLIEGTTDAGLASGGTSISGAFLADLPVISAPDYVVLTIDPDEVTAAAEIVHVTNHTASATTATILRAQESTSQPANWPSGTKVVASLTAAPMTALRTELDAEVTARTTLEGEFDAHDGSTDGHPVATISVDGLMAGADKAKLDGIEAAATADQTITAGSGLTGGGTGDVTLSHDDTSSAGSVNNTAGTVIQDVTLDGFGHVTALGSVNLDGRYYTETEINANYDTSTEVDTKISTAFSDRSEAVKAYVTSNYAFGNAQDVQITLGSESYDDWGGHSTSVNSGRINDDGAGLYLAIAQVGFATNTSGYRQISLYKNGTLLAVSRQDPVQSDGTIMQVSAVVSCSGSDYIECRIYQDSGGNVTVLGGSGNSWFQLAKLAV